jgi:phosphatidate cytidylyltransferase
MLKYRLILGTLMTVFFAGLVIFDGWLDGSLTASIADDKPIQGTLLCILVALVIIPAQLELSKLASVKNIRIFTPVSIVASILFATSWYWRQFVEFPPEVCFYLLSAFSLFALYLYQHACCGTSNVLVNCGVSCFSIFYLGLLIAFVPAIRIDFGPWHLLMFIFVVKCADIGAYTVGKLCGRHKFSPRISPGKTWEGMAGGIAGAVLSAILFAISCGIMAWPIAVVFGVCFAFIGQLGDLAESMIKRDVEQKDSSHAVPGYGGILDVVDSPLVAAPLAYLFFMVVC